METFEAIKNRRSIRKYKPDNVPDELIEKVLEAARLAPSWSNVQGWKFIVVRSAELRSQLADTVQAHPSLGTNPSTNAFRMAPVVIVALAEKNKAGYFDNRPATDKGDAWYMLDIGIAMENLVLAAADLGLGTVHVGLFDAAKVARLLDVPDSYHVVEMTPLGYPEFQPNPRPRKALTEIVYYDKFGRSK
jgi:nitroreductase